MLSLGTAISWLVFFFFLEKLTQHQTFHWIYIARFFVNVGRVLAYFRVQPWLGRQLIAPYRNIWEVGPLFKGTSAVLRRYPGSSPASSSLSQFFVDSIHIYYLICLWIYIKPGSDDTESGRYSREFIIADKFVALGSVWKRNFPDNSRCLNVFFFLFQTK